MSLKLTEVSPQVSETPPLTASVVIATRNRKDDLRIALHSIIRQDVSLEVLVIDDGSTDGTHAMVQAEFPSVRLERSESSCGYIVQRNLAAALATGDIVISMDDDAVLPSARTIAQTLADFSDPRIGAVAMPYIDVKYDSRIRQKAPDRDRVYVTGEYRGTAHALRRDLFLRLGGYRTFLLHQAEEGDYCIRMLEAGRFVRLGTADPLHHMESPKRDRSHIMRQMMRNNMLFAWYNVPLPFLLMHLPATIVKCFIFGLRRGYIIPISRGFMAGVQAMWHEYPARCPVRRATYRLARTLRRLGVTRLEDVAQPH